MTVVNQEVAKISNDEVRKALKRMKSGKAFGPDDIPVAVEFLTGLLRRCLRNSVCVLVPIFKNKGDVQSC